MMDVIFYIFVFPGLLSSIFFGFLYQGLSRKLTARMQHRVGPPIWQPFLDWVKTLSKENIKPKTAAGFFFTLSPVLVFSSLLTVSVFLPISKASPFGFEGDVILVIYFLVLSSLAYALAGFSSSSVFGSLGSIREIVQMFAYEFPFIVSILTIGIFTQLTLKPFFGLLFPFAFLGFLFSVQGKLSLPPFHIPEAEQEIVAGPLTDYSGSRLALFLLSDAVKFWTLVSLGVVMFLGGGNVLEFFVKSFTLLFILVCIKTVFARFRIDQSFRFYWFVIGPLTLIDLFRAMVM